MLMNTPVPDDRWQCKCCYRTISTLSPLECVVSGPVVHGLGLAGPVLGAPAVVAAEPVAAEVAVVEE